MSSPVWTPRRSTRASTRPQGGSKTWPLWDTAGTGAAPPEDCPHGPYAAVAARLQVLPEGLHLGEVHLVEGDGHLPDGVVTAEAVVVQHLEVQHPLHHLLIGEPCDGDGGDEEAAQELGEVRTDSSWRPLLPPAATGEPAPGGGARQPLRCHPGPSRPLPSKRKVSFQCGFRFFRFTLVSSLCFLSGSR